MRWMITAGLFCWSAACQQTIEQELDRREAAEILARLAAHGISAEKVAGRDGQTHAVRVASSDQERAVQILAQDGLPRRRHAGLGMAYRDKALVSGKLEEQGRFLLAIQEELAETLEAVEGVLAARVHLALPRDGARAAGDGAPPVSAAVLITFRGDETAALPIAQADVQRLISHACPGLEAERVAVVFSRSSMLRAPVLAGAGAEWIRVGAAGMGLGGGAAGLSLAWLRRRARRRTP